MAQKGQEGKECGGMGIIVPMDWDIRRYQSGFIPGDAQLEASR